MAWLVRLWKVAAWSPVGRSWEAFGPLLASQAWYHGFAAATRKVFVSDGSATIEKLQRTHFSHYTSVLDILHALSYSLAAARAVSDNEESAREKYDRLGRKNLERSRRRRD